MKEKQLNFISIFIMGLFWPASSLLFVNKQKIAISSAILLLISTFLLIYSPIHFIPLSLYFFLAILFIIWLVGIMLTIINKNYLEKLELTAKLPSCCLYFIIIFFIPLLLTKLPVNFYTVQQQFDNVNKNDILVIQEKVSLNLHNYNDSVIFYNDEGEEHFGIVKAVAGDVLEFENNTLLRNGKKLASISHFPVKKLIVPDNLFLIQHDKNLSIDLSKEEKEKIIKEDIKSLSFITIHRIKGKALFILYSSNIANIGKRLVFTTVEKS